MLTLEEYRARRSTSPSAGFLLMHMQEPVAALEKMLFWTKPGGIVAVQEFDFGAIAVEPICPAMAEFNRLFESVFRGHGRNLRAGRQLPAQFEAAGIGAPDGTWRTRNSCRSRTWRHVDRRLPKPVAGGGGARHRRSGAGVAFRADMTEAGEDGRYYCLTPILIAAWKRVA